MHTFLFFGFVCKVSFYLLYSTLLSRTVGRPFVVQEKRKFLGPCFQVVPVGIEKINIREPVWCSGSHSFLSPRVLWLSNFVHLSRVLNRPCVSGSQISLICPVPILPPCHPAICCLVPQERRGKSQQMIWLQAAFAICVKCILSSIKQSDHTYWYCCTLAAGNLDKCLNSFSSAEQKFLDGSRQMFSVSLLGNNLILGMNS